MLHKRIVLPMIGVAVCSATLFGVASANAQSAIDNPQETIVQRIADTFKLDKTEVQKVFDEAHTERHAQMQARLEEKLTQAVTDGKITETQKQAIMTKFSELKKPENIESFKNMTPEQRKAEMEKKQADLKVWAESQGLSLETLQEVSGGFKHKGFGHGMKGFGMRGGTMPLPSPTQ